MLRRTREECILDLPSLTRTVVRVLPEHLDRTFTGKLVSSSSSSSSSSIKGVTEDSAALEDNNDNEKYCNVGLLSEESALLILRQEVTAQKERQRLLRRRRGLQEEEENEEESCVEEMNSSDLLASLSHEQRLGLAKVHAAMEWLLTWLKETSSSSGRGGRKVVVFARHLVVLNALHHMLNQR